MDYAPWILIVFGMLAIIIGYMGWRSRRKK